MREMGINFLMISGHPDDYTLFGGGMGQKIIKNGGRVKFISMTMGEQGNPFRSGGELARKRLSCCGAVEDHFGVDIEVWNFHDGETWYTLETRNRVLEAIRTFKTDIVVCPHPFCTHPDLKNTGELVQEAAYFSSIINILPNVPALERKPVVLYPWWHEIRSRVSPFQSDIAITSEDIIDELCEITALHGSTVYEWAAFKHNMLEALEQMSEKERILWHRKTVIEPFHQRRAEIGRTQLIERYGIKKGGTIRFAEVFEISEYGRQPEKRELEQWISETTEVEYE